MIANQIYTSTIQIAHFQEIIKYYYLLRPACWMTWYRRRSKCHVGSHRQASPRVWAEAYRLLDLEEVLIYPDTVDGGEHRGGEAGGHKRSAFSVSRGVPRKRWKRRSLPLPVPAAWGWISTAGWAHEWNRAHHSPVREWSPSEPRLMVNRLLVWTIYAYAAENSKPWYRRPVCSMDERPSKYVFLG